MNDKIKRVIVSLHYDLVNFILLAFRRLFFKKLNRNTIRKILIFRIGSIGDTICAFPAFTTICNNFPQAEIDILTTPGKKEFISLELLLDSSQVNNIINYRAKNKRQLFKEISANKYDLFIELTGSKRSFWRQLRTIFFVKMMGIKHGLGWNISRTMVFPKWQVKHRTFLNEQNRLLAVLKKEGLETVGVQIQLNISSELKERVALEAKNAKLLNKRENIGLVVGANHDHKKWPIGYFSKVADYYISKGYNLILFGGPDDQELASTLEHTQVFNFCGKLYPLESAEMMKYCSLVISNDTGPMHMAYAVGTPVIDLVSSRDYPGEWYPPDDGINRVFRTPDILCSQCLYRKCYDNICMQAISPEMVIDAANEILKDKPITLSREKS